MKILSIKQSIFKNEKDKEIKYYTFYLQDNDYVPVSFYGPRIITMNIKNNVLRAYLKQNNCEVKDLINRDLFVKIDYKEKHITCLANFEDFNKKEVVKLK